MRPRSLVGPLILILLGVLFLANNTWPELSIRNLVSLYWPFLLIAWGVLRLGEVLVWASTSKRTPCAGISGGEWFLILLICLIGSGCFWFERHGRAFHVVGPWGPKAVEVFGHPYDFPLSDQKHAGTKPHIVIENLHGDTRVVVGDTEDIKVEGRKTVRAFMQSEADLANRQSPLQLTVNGGQVLLSTCQERVSGDRQVRTDLDITVPRGSDVQGHSRSGDFDIAGIEGNVVINSDNAAVRLQNIGGDVRVNTRKSEIVRAVGVKGLVELHGRGSDVHLENITGPVMVEGTYTGDQKYLNLAKPLRVQTPGTQLQVEATPGQITMDLSDLSGTNLVGPIRLEATSKDVHLEDFKQSLQLSVNRGDISLRPGQLPLGKIDARTRNGDVALALPKDAKFQLSASTSHGEIQNNFGAGFKANTEGHRATLEGAVGSGPAITIDTTRGSITVDQSELKNAPKETKQPKGETVSIETPAGKIEVRKE